jgi:hypothetical protein
MALWPAVAIALTLVVATVLIHYELLRGTSLLIPRLAIPPRTRLLVVLGAVFVAHSLEVTLYAIALYTMHQHGALGGIAGTVEGTAFDFLYLSITSFTTLGVGDVFPTGPMRLVVAVESLNGLVLIGWSASFTYLAMEKFWDQHPRRRRAI